MPVDAILLGRDYVVITTLHRVFSSTLPFFSFPKTRRIKSGLVPMKGCQRLICGKGYFKHRSSSAKCVEHRLKKR